MRVQDNQDGYEVNEEDYYNYFKNQRNKVPAFYSNDDMMMDAFNEDVPLKQRMRNRSYSYD